MKRLAVIAAVMLLIVCAALGEPAGLQVSLEGDVRPGAPVLITVTVSQAGEYDLFLTDEAGQTVFTVTEKRPAEAGANIWIWNGTRDGVPAPEGEWQLVAAQGEQRASVPVTVAKMAPCLIAAKLETETIRKGENARLNFFATERGTLTIYLEEKEEPLLTREIKDGWADLDFPAGSVPGVFRLKLVLTTARNGSSEPVYLTLTVEGNVADRWAEWPKKTKYTPTWGSPAEGSDPTLNYWTLPMDITDTEAIWEVLTAPVTVLDNGKTNAERTQVRIRKEPREDSPGIGVVTCITQSVHVLERGDEWTLIECYSSSFHDSGVKNWNALVQGYVPTAYLKEILPDQTLGLVVDKLDQKLYIFRYGELYDILQVSTGLANERQPYNETRSGEFLIHSWVGAITSDDIVGRLAMRFNDGDLIHEVPYVLMSDGKSKDFTVCERKLGTKASHGCIRVQRKATPKGTNHEWLWTNRKRDMKILIWEDWQGRQLAYPDDHQELYVTLGRNAVYHTSRKCSQLKGAKTNVLTYGQLEEEAYAKAKRCSTCNAPLRKAEIAAINEKYAEGGDHDPVMSEAREKARKALEEESEP
jgi:hypothetical protein